jgi:2-octaprenylphenol hydroxylase
MLTYSYDVIIIGGGIVGLTLACALASSHLTIAICETNPPTLNWDKTSLDARVSAINRTSETIFSNIGVWDKIREAGINPYYEMNAWDAHSHGNTHFNCQDINEANLGYIIENRVMQRALYEYLQNFDDITYLCPAMPHSLQLADTSHPSLVLSDGKSLSAQLIVGADGAHSWLREHAQMPLKQWDYGHTAITAIVETECSHQQTAWQCFLNDGPIALLPLSDPFHCVLVWSSSDAARLMALDEPAFQQELGKCLDHRLGLVTKVITQRARFPLTMRHASLYTKPGIALIGDAAHTFHPLAGQGMNLGLLDAACLAEVVSNMALKHHPLGYHPLLQRYERWRKGNNLLMIALMEGFKRGFSTPWLNPLRYMGLNFADKFQPFKNYLTRQALGYSYDLPKIAQPPP